MKDKTEGLYGIDGNWIYDSLIGIISGILFIIFGNLFGIIGALGLPTWVNAIALDDWGRILVICIVAPIAEELFFRDLVLDFFNEKLKNFGFDPNYLISSIIGGGITFAIYHYATYSGGLNVIGSFISAGVVGFGLSYIRYYTKSNIGNIFAHSIINFYILNLIFKYISFGI